MRALSANLTWIVVLLATAAAAAAAQVPGSSVRGIPNFHEVTDRIWRGGQPKPYAWSDLAKLGVQTVIDLRRPSEHSTSAESLAVTAAGMSYVNFPMDSFGTPTAAQLGAPLAVLDGPSAVFVHCKHGRDRTGIVIASYRISRDHWPNDRALAEAHEHGLHWYEYGMKRFIASYRP